MWILVHVLRIGSSIFETLSLFDFVDIGLQVIVVAPLYQAFYQSLLQSFNVSHLSVTPIVFSSPCGQVN